MAQEQDEKHESAVALGAQYQEYQLVYRCLALVDRILVRIGPNRGDGGSPPITTK